MTETDQLNRLVQPRVAKIHREPFTRAECMRLLEAATLSPDPFLERALLTLGPDTGARIGEMWAVDIDDVDLEGGSIVFRKTKNGRPPRVFVRVPGREDGGPCIVALADWVSARAQRAQPLVRTLSVATPVGRGQSGSPQRPGRDWRSSFGRRPIGR
jgi:site-specific recombinase XerC